MTEAKPSKSERKREHLALQELGESLIGLSDENLAALDLGEELLKAVRDAAHMRAHGALRRQKQLIGKLMRNVDAEAVRRHLEQTGSSERREKQLFAAAERWRDRLLSEDPAAQDAFAAVAGHDDELARLLDQLDATFDERREKSLRKAVFRRVRELLDARQDTAGPGA